MVRRHSLVAALVLVMGLAVSLSAHMKLEKSMPAADSTVKAPLKMVQIWFSEAPDAAVSKLTLNGPSGEVKLTGLHVMKDKSLMASVDGTPAPGKYTLTWQSSGDDGHAQKGEIAFTLEAAQ